MEDGQESRNAGKPPEPGKSKKQDSLLEPPESSAAMVHLDFSSLEPILDFSPSDL
jgi:hypothetical protein